ncbi:MAG: hypothetical protein WCD86_16975 [Ktedonobacteraceae bacterium]
MREYPDPQQYIVKHMERSAAKYRHGLKRAGLQPNITLTNAMIEQAIEEGKEGYIREAEKVLDHNTRITVRNHRRQMNKLMRQGSSLRMKVCPPIAALFGFMAWYSFSHAEYILAIVYAVGALVFLAMLFLGAIFDRPR